MSLPQRKPTRLSGYDYGTNGAYFITVCTKDKKKLLGSVVGGGLCAAPEISLSAIGKEIQQAIFYMNGAYEGVTVDKAIIMPNHIYLLITVKKEAGGRGSPPLQDMIGRFKSFTTKQYGAILWQRSFHDHIIRGEQDYLEHWQYIDENPAKWQEDPLYIK